MGSSVSENKKFIAISIVAVSLFAIGSLAAKSIEPGETRASAQHVPQDAVASIEQSSFEASLKSLSSTLYAWSSRKPEEKAY
ncbi:MAG: hypothetical protein AAF420_03775 [Pseudomonadota bacterium]